MYITQPSVCRKVAESCQSTSMIFGDNVVQSACGQATRQNEPFCLMFKTVPIDFSGFQGCQNAKTVDNTITPSELIAHCPLSFRHIHRPKAASRYRQLMAETRQSNYIKINVSYRETHPSTPDKILTSCFRS